MANEGGDDPFVDEFSAAEAVADLFKGRATDFVDEFAGGEVGFELGLIPSGFEVLDEIGGGGDFDAAGADEFYGAGVDHGDIGDGAIG